MTLSSGAALDNLLKDLFNRGVLGVDVHRGSHNYVALPYDDRGVIVSHQALRQAMALTKLIPPDLDQFPDPYILTRSTVDRPSHGL